jgi:transcriptional regulator
MYNVPYFKAERPEEVVEFMRQHPFVVLCGSDGQGKPVATHLPLLLEERENQLYLQGHCMRKQDHTEAFRQNPQVLAIFSDAHTYVSASWYKDKKVASTWNYQAVHVSGVLRFLDDAGLLDLLTRLTRKMEGNESPSLVEHLEPEYLSRTMKAIVAFEIKVTGVEHVFKLSQNRDEESYGHIVSHLQAGDTQAQQVAKIMGEKSFSLPKRKP